PGALPTSPGHGLPSRSTGMVAAPGRLARPLARRAPACRPGVGGDPNRRPRGVAPLAARALAVPPRAAPGDARLSRLSVGRGGMVRPRADQDADLVRIPGLLRDVRPVVGRYRSGH